MTATSQASRVSELARADVRGIPLYLPDTAACDVDVSDNTNLWGAPPAAMRAMAEASPAVVARYPALYAGPLRAAILGYLGLDRADDSLAVVTGCGSDDVIDSAMRAFGPAGGRIAFSSPTFSMIPVFARLNGLVPAAVPFMADGGVDAERLLACDADITYLCTPNNPTATPISRAVVEHVCERARGIVMIDEAYAEFAGDTFADMAQRHERVIVTRTFSKAFGLAGLRVGYGLASAPLAEMVERARGPYKVNTMAERAVLAALQPGDDAAGWVRAHAALAVVNRDRLGAELSALGLPPLPSAANFVFVPAMRARELAAALAGRGVLVRAFAGLPQELPALAASGGAALRIGVGPWPLMERLLAELRTVLAGSPAPDAKERSA